MIPRMNLSWKATFASSNKLRTEYDGISLYVRIKFYVSLSRVAWIM